MTLTHSPLPSGVRARYARISEQEMSCLASWSEGSARYLVGHLLDAVGIPRSPWDRSRSPTMSGKDIRCFRYESRFGGASGTGVTLHMAQSFTSSCMGLWSVDEGARTFRMNKGKSFYLIRWDLVWRKSCFHSQFTETN